MWLQVALVAVSTSKHLACAQMLVAPVQLCSRFAQPLLGIGPMGDLAVTVIASIRFEI